VCHLDNSILLVIILTTSQVLRIHGVHSERRVFAKVKTDWNHFFGFGDVMISVPTNCPIPMCCIKKDGSCEYVVICRVRVFNATFNKTSVISGRSVLLVEKNDKLSNFITYCCIEYTLPERDSNSQRTDDMYNIVNNEWTGNVRKVLRYQWGIQRNKGNNTITEQSYKGKVKTHKYINRQNQSTT
jgi:hypothetical protein